MPRAGFKWIERPVDIFHPAFEAYAWGVRNGVEKIMYVRGAQGQNWMRENAPWTDRTGNARQGLYTFIEKDDKAVALWFSHGVMYGVHLELAHAGAYAIVVPAIDEFGQIVWDDIKDMMS